MSDRPLSDLRVLTFGAFVAGNTAALILAELGMDVVKIESHVRPEALRNTYFLDHPDTREPSGVPTTALYGGLARSVRSVSIELGRAGRARGVPPPGGHGRRRRRELPARRARPLRLRVRRPARR